VKGICRRPHTRCERRGRRRRWRGRRCAVRPSGARCGGVLPWRAGFGACGRAAEALRPRDAGVRRVGRRGRPRAQRARAADGHCAAVPAPCAYPATAACARPAPARVPLLCARCVRAVLSSKPPDLPRWWLRTHDAAPRFIVGTACMRARSVCSSFATFWAQPNGLCRPGSRACHLHLGRTQTQIASTRSACVHRASPHIASSASSATASR